MSASPAFPNQVKWGPLLVIVLVATALLLFIDPATFPSFTLTDKDGQPYTAALSQDAWLTVVIFIACIAAIVANVLPIGAIGIIGITVYAVVMGLFHAAGAPDSEKITAKWVGVALSELDASLIWLIVCAFLVARGFIKTGFGKRIALLMIRLLGKRTLGLAYGLAVADLLLAPAMPSNTARCGGVIYPIANSLALSYDSKPNDPSSRRLGSFLITCIGTVNDITSAVFLTAFTGNLLAVQLAAQAGVEFSFASWFLYASVPCLVALLLVPLFVYLVNPPTVKKTPEAPRLAAQQLAEMGPMSYGEKIMALTVLLLLTLWVGGKYLHIDATAAAMIGLCFLLLSSVLTWEDVKAEKGAWDTLIWFAALLMMATQLRELGFTDWFGGLLSSELLALAAGLHWVTVLLLLNAIYLYTHYFFASGNAQIAALYTVFLGVAGGLGVPLAPAAFMLAITSNLYCSLTQYTHARGPILFGSGYVSTTVWWRTGFLVTLLTQAIFFTVGLFWWKLMGLY